MFLCVRSSGVLTHLSLEPHICVSVGSDNGWSPIRRQAIILSNAGLLHIRSLGTNFSEILIKIQHFSFTKIHPSVKWRPFCPGGYQLMPKLCFIYKYFYWSLSSSWYDSNYYWIFILLSHGFLKLDIFGSAIAHFPVCFCPWTVFENVGFHMLLSGSFIIQMNILG